jgi:hypothetical protein
MVGIKEFDNVNETSSIFVVLPPLANLSITIFTLVIVAVAGIIIPSIEVVNGQEGRLPLVTRALAKIPGTVFIHA